MDYFRSSKSLSRATSIHSRSSPRGKFAHQRKSKVPECIISEYSIGPGVGVQRGHIYAIRQRGHPRPTRQTLRGSKHSNNHSRHTRARIHPFSHSPSASETPTIAVHPPTLKRGQNLGHGTPPTVQTWFQKTLLWHKRRRSESYEYEYHPERVRNCLTLVHRVIDDRVPIWGWYSYYEPLSIYP